MALRALAGTAVGLALAASALAQGLGPKPVPASALDQDYYSACMDTPPIAQRGTTP